MMDRTLPSVGDIRIMEARGPWKSKSGGDLQVVFSLPFDILLQEYLRYPRSEEGKPDIRGLRVYTVRGVDPGCIGGTEWHHAREEMVYVLEGLFRWRCEDGWGNKREFTLDPEHGIWMPPCILHEYEALVKNSGLLVVANTTFDPDDPSTHDTFSDAEFRKHQAEVADPY